MKNYIYMMLIVMACIVCACSKDDEPASVPQSELNKNIVGLTKPGYYDSWDPTQHYGNYVGAPSCVLEYEIEGCQKVAVHSLNQLPYDICKKGTTIIVSDIDRYTEYINANASSEYIPLRLMDLGLKYEDQGVMYSNLDSTFVQTLISWRHIDGCKYELKFKPNTTGKNRTIGIVVTFSKHDNPRKEKIPRYFGLIFRQLAK